MTRALHPQRSALRGRLEAAIEVAIATLDLLDGDADLEPETDGKGEDDEANLCGVTFGWGAWDGIDLEANIVRPFQWDQRIVEGDAR